MKSHRARDGVTTVVSCSTCQPIAVRTTPKLEVGSPAPLFALQGRTWADFAVAADGKRFLAVVPQAFAGEQPLTVILNWTSEVRR